MQIPESKVYKYMEIYERKNGKPISKKKAYIELLALVILMESVYQELNKNNK